MLCFHNLLSFLQGQLVLCEILYFYKGLAVNQNVFGFVKFSFISYIAIL